MAVGATTGDGSPNEHGRQLQEAFTVGKQYKVSLRGDKLTNRFQVDTNGAAYPTTGLAG